MEPLYNLYVDQGSTFKYPLTIVDETGLPIDLSTAIVKAQARTNFGSATPYEFVCVMVDAVNGMIELQLPFAVTAMMSGRYVFDAFYYKGTDAVRFLNGIVVVSPSVTKLS